MRHAVLFDLDGTLVDHETAARSAVLAWSKEHGGDQHSPTLLVQEWLRLETLHFGAYLGRSITFEEQRRFRVRDYLAFLGQPTLDADDAVDMLFATYLKHYEQSWTAYEDASPALAALKEQRITVGVLTNGQQAQQEAKLQAVGLLADLNCVVATSTLSASKPAPEAFAEACDRLGYLPGAVFYVGDNLHVDALAADQAGLRGVWLNREAKEAEGAPSHIIRSLHEVPALVTNAV